MLDHSPSAILQELIQGFSHTHQAPQFATYASADQYLKLYKLLSKYVGQGGHVLDWGAGFGHFSYFLVRSGYTTSGFGFEGPPELCKGLDASRYQYVQGSLIEPTRMPFDDSCFDAVVSVGVLEHVRETGGEEIGSLREIYRILKPGGVFICYHFPNRLSWIEALARRSRRFSHIYSFTQADIDTMIEATAFQLLEAGRYGFLPRNSWRSPILAQASIGIPFAALYNQADAVLERLLPWLCQNYFFVARKP